MTNAILHAYMRAGLTEAEARQRMEADKKLRPCTEAKARLAEATRLLREWCDPTDCGCDTACCQGTCLAGRTNDFLEPDGDHHVE